MNMELKPDKVKFNNNSPSQIKDWRGYNNLKDKVKSILKCSAGQAFEVTDKDTLAL